MKKIVVFFLLAAMVCVANAYAMDFKLINIRDKIFDQSRSIKALMNPKSGDSILLISMFNSCLYTAVQLDAYFSMVGIFETMSDGGANDEAIRFIASWLNQIKSTAAVNIQGLDSVSQVESSTKLQIQKLRVNLASLEPLIDSELQKFVALKLSVNKQKK